MRKSEGKCHCGCNARTRKIDSNGRWDAHCVRRWNGHGAAAAAHTVKVRRAAKVKLQELLQHRGARLGQRAAASAPNASLPADGGDLRTTLPADGGSVCARLREAECQLKELQKENIDLKCANAPLRPSCFL